MKFTQTYLLTFLLLLSTLTKAQSKDCNVNYMPGPIFPCTLTPTKIINDTATALIPKGCNDVKFDSTANGHWKVYSLDTLRQIIGFKNGIKNGQNIYFYSNGKIQAILNYSNGKLFGETVLYNATGQIIEKGVHDNREVFSGTVTQYWDNGKIASLLECKGGYFNGTTKYWDNKGKSINKKTFEKLWYNCN